MKEIEERLMGKLVFLGGVPGPCGKKLLSCNNVEVASKLLLQARRILRSVNEIWTVLQSAAWGVLIHKETSLHQHRSEHVAENLT